MKFYERTVKHNYHEIWETLPVEKKKEAFYAIGYLSTWGLEGYTDVEIMMEKDGDMIATYRRADSQCRYVIAAIWNVLTQSYSFHS